MTTARLKMNNGLYPEAEAALNKELAKNPKNAEAIFLMATAKFKLKKVKEAADYLMEADKMQLEPKYRMQVPTMKFNIWAAAYNDGISLYNKFLTTKDVELLNKAVNNYDIAIKVRPDNADFYRLKGITYESLNQEEKVIECYLAYYDKLKKEIEYGKNAKIFLTMPREDVLKKLGKPKETWGFRRSVNDSSLTDEYSVMGRMIYLYYKADKNNNFTVEGWRVAPAQDWLPNELANFSVLDPGPFASLAEIYYNRALDIANNTQLDSASRARSMNQNLELAKDYTRLITILEPTNVEANRFLINIFEVQGRSEEALEEVARLVESDKGNKYYLAQYGEILFRLDKYDESIEQYKKALAIDPSYCDVQRNIAAAYKNKASQIQRQQQDKYDRDKNFKENPDEFRPLLVESSKFFTECRKCDKYKNDLLVIGELADIYNFLGQKEDLDLAIDALERLEHIIPDEQKEMYWGKMCKIYGDIKSPKQQKACDEFQKLIK
jgi:tetratricopeptide (TPR) repeat protein